MPVCPSGPLLLLNSHLHMSGHTDNQGSPPSSGSITPPESIFSDSDGSDETTLRAPTPDSPQSTTVYSPSNTFYQILRPHPSWSLEQNKSNVKDVKPEDIASAVEHLQVLLDITHIPDENATVLRTSFEQIYILQKRWNSLGKIGFVTRVSHMRQFFPSCSLVLN